MNRLRRDIGFVFQQFKLFPRMPVLDDITIAPRKLRGRSEAAAQENTHALLTRRVWPTRPGAYPGQRQGSQAQRVRKVAFSDLAQLGFHLLFGMRSPSFINGNKFQYESAA